MTHSARTVGPGRHVILRDETEIGMLSFDRPVPREATVIRRLCELLNETTAESWTSRA